MSTEVTLKSKKMMKINEKIVLRFNSDKPIKTIAMKNRVYVSLCTVLIRSGRNVNSATIAESHYYSEITLNFEP